MRCAVKQVWVRSDDPSKLATDGPLCNKGQSTFFNDGWTFHALHSTMYRGYGLRFAARDISFGRGQYQLVRTQLTQMNLHGSNAIDDEISPLINAAVNSQILQGVLGHPAHAPYRSYSPGSQNQPKLQTLWPYCRAHCACQSLEGRHQGIEHRNGLATLLAYMLSLLVTKITPQPRQSFSFNK